MVWDRQWVHRASVGSLAVLVGLAVAIASGWAGAQASDPAAWQARRDAVLELKEPAPNYDPKDIPKPIITLDQMAWIPGLPVRQQPVNAGRFDDGCGQCHRLSGPLPADSGAPRDVFDRLPASRIAASPPPGFVRLTTAPTRETVPLWSPDGASVLYEVQATDGTWSLWLMNVDGGDQRPLANEVESGWANWSPTGDRIVYWARGGGGSSNLWLVRADGSDRHRITDHAAVAFPVWSPDGSAIAYQAKDAAGTWTLRLLRLDGQTDARISPPDQAIPSRPQWSPDGRTLAYQAAQDGTFALWRLVFSSTPEGAPDYARPPRPLPGSTLLPMDLGQAGGSSTWSPDGTRIAVQMPAIVHSDVFGQPLLTYKTWLTRADGSGPSLLLPYQTLADRSPSWSPDGRWIAQWSWGHDLMAAVWLSRPDGSQSVDLTAAMGADALAPAWSPDGAHVAFSSNRAGTFDIWIADVDEVVAGPAATTP